MRKKVGVLCFLLLSVQIAIAQQEAQFTQYMFNGLVINPAYAGSQEVMNITAAWRRQWVSIEGAPETQSLSIHAPTGNDRVAWGALAVNDQIGIHRNIRLFGMYAYRIPFQNGKLSMGLQAGYMFQRSDYTNATTQFPDPAFQENYSEGFPEFGAGLYYYTDRWHVGISAPKVTGNLFSNDPRRIDNERHIYLQGGYVFGINTILQLHPSILVKSVSGSAISYDLNLNAVLNNVIWAGISLRSFNSFNALLQLQITPQIRAGYSYDTQFSGFTQARAASHEIMLNYFFNFRKEKVISPRIF